MAQPKHICILGSTGSIGRSSLEVISRYPDRFKAVCLSTNGNIRLLREQIELFRPEAVAVIDAGMAQMLKRDIVGSVRVFAGEDGLLELASWKGVDIVLNALVGFAGLRPTVQALENGRTIALANKETLVAGGAMVVALAKRKQAAIIPIDSEHSAILQCLAGEEHLNIRRIILTASGGPFLHFDRNALENVSVEESLKHPNWSMGRKITIDSATMMNKGLEMIEAHWLFHLPPERIDVVIHPQSIIHSMVEFSDGSIKAQMGIPDMKIPIQYALTAPDRLPSDTPGVDFAALGRLTFLPPDSGHFPCLGLAVEALKAGGTAPVVLNAANEVAVDAFLRKHIRFTQISSVIRESLNRCKPIANPALQQIMDADQTAREAANDFLQRLAGKEVYAGH